MTDPLAETHWCRQCETHRCRHPAGLCPACADDEAHPERATRKPPQ